MKWSFRLGELFGIDVRVHLTFVLLLAWIGFATFTGTGSLLATLISVAGVMALFAIVVLHEYGHALTARKYGIRTRHITLYPIGGMAMLERMPTKPMEQLWIAIAGPAVNFVLAALIAIALVARGTALSLAWPDTIASVDQLLQILFTVNIFMGGFNLLPATPLDGGRILRALLNLRLPSLRAARIATRVGRVVAIFMGLYALLPPGHTMLLIIAIFVWFSSGAELAMEERMAELARGWPGQGWPPQGWQSPTGQAQDWRTQPPPFSQGTPPPPQTNGPPIEVLDAEGRIIGIPEPRSGERFALQVVDGPFGRRLRLVRLD